MCCCSLFVRNKFAAQAKNLLFSMDSFILWSRYSKLISGPYTFSIFYNVITLYYQNQPQNGQELFFTNKNHSYQYGLIFIV